MKILFVGAAPSNHTARWVNALSKRGHEVILVSRGDQRDDLNQISNKVKIEYLKYGGGIGYYLNTLQIKRIYKKFRPDIVNAHYATGYGTLCRLANLQPLVLSCWGSDIFDFPKKCRRNRRLLEKNFEFANVIASTSLAMAEECKQYLKNDNREVYVTPFGVDTELFFPNKKNNVRPTIGIVKYLKPIYDIQLLIKAFAIVCQKTSYNPILKIYGSGPLKEDLKRLVFDLNLEDDVEFYDTIPNEKVASVICDFDIFINCSKVESFGVAVLEAMSCELPVIVTKTKGYCEIVEDKKTGIILKDRKPSTMAEAIIQLLENDDLRKRFGIEGRKRVEKFYDWNKNVDTMIELYNKVLQGKNKNDNTIFEKGSNDCKKNN